MCDPPFEQIYMLLGILFYLDRFVFVFLFCFCFVFVFYSKFVLFCFVLFFSVLFCFVLVRKLAESIRTTQTKCGYMGFQHADAAGRPGARDERGKKIIL